MGDATHGRRKSAVGAATCGCQESAVGKAIHNWEKDAGIPRTPVTNVFRMQHMNKPTLRLAPRTRLINGWGMTTADLPPFKVGTAILEVVWEKDTGWDSWL